MTAVKIQIKLVFFLFFEKLADRFIHTIVILILKFRLNDPINLAH